jgi:N-acyl-D-aspartate/D-glutamate deacylase
MGLDLLIRNGTIVDGSGAARYQGDVGIRQGQIVEIGRLRAGAERVIDADGLIVAPGFVDGHTHMDAQVAWDRIGSCSCWHGVTTVIMGNCGFALAPCRPEEREWFARCLTAVEDIPTESMLAGIDWTWETFPEYLATVDRLPKAINYGAYIGHSALRMYVMGKRALSETATDQDLARMAGAVKEAIRAGAMGFSSSRATTHVTPDNTPVASRIADWAEVDRLVGAMAELGAGIFQVGPDISGGLAQRAFLARLQRVAVESGRPVMFGTIASRQGDDPNPWTYQLEYLDQCAAAGARVWGQTTTRSINAIFSLKSYLPFDVLPAWRDLRRLPLPEQKRRLADPATRRQLMAAEATMKPRDNVFQGGGAATTDPRRPDYGNLYAMKDVNWNDPTVAQLAAARGQHPVEVMIDLALENENQVFVQPLVNEHPDQVLGMLKHPRTLATFSDSGAHLPGDGLLAPDPHAELLGAREAGVHPRGGGAQAHLRQRVGLGYHRPWPAARGLPRRPRAVRRGAREAGDAHGRGRFARRRPPPRAEGGGHRRHYRQRRSHAGTRHADRPPARRLAARTRHPPGLTDRLAVPSAPGVAGVRVWEAMSP